MLQPKKTPEEIVNERLAELDMGGDLGEGTPKTGRDLTAAIRSGWFDGDDVIRWMTEVIEADQAQRELDDNDPEGLTHEFVVKLHGCTYEEAQTVMHALAYDENVEIDYSIEWRNR